MSIDSAAEPVARPMRSSLATIYIVVRRELRDTLRDWRIVSPIVVLTLFFPWLMNWTAQMAVNFVQARQAPIIGERMIPFLLMVVGFFPVSFSLIIALETFVGEKERRSIEPLLSMPITDLELYLGKMIAATALPLLGSVLGVLVYLGGLYWAIGYLPPLELFIQIFVLNIVGGVVMVAGAVVISSQTTSVRAANLLASFVVIPMALLVQGESVIMFWARYNVLWVIALALVIVAVILVRMGIKTFNREEILGREIDELNVRRIGRLFVRFFVGPVGGEPAGSELETRARSAPTRLARWLGRVYRHDLPLLLRHNWMPIAVVVVTLIGATIAGWAYVQRYPLPAGLLKLENVSAAQFDQMSQVSFLPALTTGGIFRHNAMVLLVASGLAMISLGVLAVLLLMAPLGITGFMAGQVALAGYDPLAFLAAFILPHGLFEIPAAVIATALALRMGASLIAPRPGMTVGEGLIASLADLIKVFLFLVLPLLLVAAFIEANVTPQIVIWMYGG